MGKEPNPRAHDLAIRDLLVKIFKSGYEITSVKLSTDLGTLLPDLEVNFKSSEGGEIKTYWEYDSGTESLSVLKTKAERYTNAPAPARPRVLIVFDSATRLINAMQAINDNTITYAVLSQFQTINDPAFKTTEQPNGASFYP